MYFVTAKFFPHANNPAQNIGYLKKTVSSIPAPTEIVDTASMPQKNQATVAVESPLNLRVLFHHVADAINDENVGVCVVSDANNPSDAFRYESACMKG